MGNTLTSNDKTVADDAKVKLIIGEIGRDTQTGIIGRGYSFDNGNTFHVTDTIYGRLYTQNDADGLWNNGLHEKVKEKVNQEITNTVEPAIKQADSAVAYANEAVKKSRVNSQAIVEINSAVSDAVSDAAVARSDGLRAWNAAQSNADLIDSNYASASAAISSARAEAIAAADEAKASASAAQADIVAVRSDVAVQAKSLLSYAAQASAAGKDITTLKSQAGQLEQDMADTKGDVSQLKVSASSASVALSDAAGNISSLQATANSYSAALSDTNSNVASVTATASELETKYANAAGDINTLKADAKGFNQTLTNAQGDISTLKNTTKGLQSTMTNAQGDISTLKVNVSGLQKTTSDHAGNIATLQADSKTLTSQMSSAQGDINTLKQTASGFSSKVSGIETSLANANSKINDITSNGGGRNLLQGTGTASGDVANGGVGNYIIKGAFNGYDAIKTNTAWDERCINLYSALGRTNAKAGDWFTLSVYVKADKQIDTGALDVFRALGNGDANTNDGSLDAIWMSNKPITTQWQQYAWSFQINDISLQRQNTRVEYNSDTGDNWIYWAGWMLEKGTVAHDWQPAPEDTDAKITTNATAIEQNKKAIALKADQTTVDKINGTVQQLQSDFKVQADQIATKVSSSDLDAKGYATQTYTQTQIKQTSDSWNANLTSVKDGLMQSYTNLHATVDGIKSTVATKADQSEVTQLSNLVQAKVSSGDFTSTTTQLKNLINQRVQVGDVISQINQEAGGNTLIQVSNGKGSLVLDAANTVVTGKAWIPVASIADLTADQIQAGTLTGSTVHLGDSNGNTIDLGVLGTNHVGLHSSAQNGDQTYIDSDGIHNYGVSYDTKINQGKITTNYMAVNGGLIDFRSNGDGTTIDSQNIKFYNSNAVNGGIEFSGGSPLATAQDGAVGNELRVRYDRSFALTPVKDESARICASSAAMQVGFVQSGSSTPDRQTTGLWVDNDNRHVNLGVWGADSTWARMEANTHNIHMQAGNAHAWLSNDNLFHIYKDGDSSSTAIELKVDGWAWVNGWVEAAGHSQHSALSTKTALQAIDDDEMLEMVNNTDLASFLFKTDVASGETHRHIGLIIDDVHDVAKYQTPQDFIAPNGVSRDDDNMIGALFGAVKALTKRIKTLESKVG